MDDLVIDTNVWVHAQNPAETRFDSSVDLLKLLLESEVTICVDVGYDLNESKNASAICCEYFKHISYGSIGLAIFVQLASSGKIKQLQKRSKQNISRKINQLVANKVDRIFLNVAYNSEDKYLVSHDYRDFQIRKRKTIKKDLTISIVEAEHMVILLNI